ncbi:MAG: hypothetical protein KDD82_15590 [Planctomycetes bacterium]|nr:hypothetical protein [Planctomycetota bacterium]
MLDPARSPVPPDALHLLVLSFAATLTALGVALLLLITPAQGACAVGSFADVPSEARLADAVQGGVSLARVGSLDGALTLLEWVEGQSGPGGDPDRLSCR